MTELIFPFRDDYPARYADAMKHAGRQSGPVAGWPDDMLNVLASGALANGVREDSQHVSGVALCEVKRRITERFGTATATAAISNHRRAAMRASGNSTTVSTSASTTGSTTASGLWLPGSDGRGSRRTATLEERVAEELAKQRAREKAAEILRREKIDAEGRPPLRSRMFTPAQFATMDAPPPLIHGVLDAGALAELIGQRGSAKTFVALDMALSIAAGKPWAGRPTERGRVLYLVGEGGGRAFGVRQEAWCLHHRVPLDDLDEWFLGHDGAVPFLSSEWDELIEFAAEFDPALVVVDTLSRHSVGMEENSNADMSRAVELVTALRERCGAATLLLHHPPKGVSATTANSGRGASAFEAAADAVFGLEREGGEELPLVECGVTMVCTKQKHRGDGDRWHFRFESHEVAKNPTWPTSLVPVRSSWDEMPRTAAEVDNRSRKQAAVREWLIERIGDEPGKAKVHYTRNVPADERHVIVDDTAMDFSIAEATAELARMVADGVVVEIEVSSQRREYRLAAPAEGTAEDTAEATAEAAEDTGEGTAETAEDTAEDTA